MRQSQSGFTLIELLIVVAIIGILASVAISNYASYKSQAVDSEMTVSLRNARTASEAFFVQNNATYTGMTLASLSTLGFRSTFGVSVDVEPSGDGTSYLLRACASGGTSPAFVVTSASGTAAPDFGACA